LYETEVEEYNEEAVSMDDKNLLSKDKNVFKENNNMRNST
jgi:hypothetical protein